MSQYVARPYRNFGGSVEVELGLSSHTTRVDFKVATGVDKSILAAKSDLASLKAKTYRKLDDDELKPVLY